MEKPEKYYKIIDSLQELLKLNTIDSISVNDIAQNAGIGKGSIYYYFASKDAIVDALIEQSYAKTLETAKSLAQQTDISSFTRMAMMFQACMDSSTKFLAHKNVVTNVQQNAYLHQKYLNHVITELKPVLSEIIKQGIEKREIHFDYPDELSEMVLIILCVKLTNSLLPSSQEEIDQLLRALIALLEKGTDTPVGALEYLLVSYTQ